MKKQGAVSVFYSVDDTYAPFLAVSLRSLADRADPERKYTVYVLNTGLSADNVSRLSSVAGGNVSLRFVDVSRRVEPLAGRLDLRDYYTLSIYYRLFIPAMFPELDRAVYLDADTVLLRDAAALYDTDLRGKFLAAVPDQVIPSRPEYIRYAELAVGVPYKKYFNSGVLVMDLKKLRAFDIEGRFCFLLNTYRFETVCPDQDYLNVMCRNRVLYLDRGWNNMPVIPEPAKELKLIHFNMFWKPWHYPDTPLGEYFRHYAALTPYAEEIAAMPSAYTKAQREQDELAAAALTENAVAIVNNPRNFRNVLSGGAEPQSEFEDDEPLFAAGQA